MQQQDTYDTIIVGGGQAGLATAFHLQKAGLSYVVLNASSEPTGSWPRYYDSLELFSPAEFSDLPGLPFPGDRKRYPKRDEVVAYMRDYARYFALNVRNNVNVEDVQAEQHHFTVRTGDREVLRARTLVAASGSFNVPAVPDIPGQETFNGKRLHAINYRSPAPFASKRVIVVGAANTAVQIAYELASVARTTLAVRSQVRFAPQVILGKDFHFWLGITGLGKTRWLKDQSTPVLDSGKFKLAISAGAPDQRQMFTRFLPTGVEWHDGTTEDVDAVIFATGYHSNLDYLKGLDAAGAPSQNGSRAGVSQQVPGLYYVGFSGQRSFASATLRGVGPDAAYVVKHLVKYLGAHQSNLRATEASS